MIYFSILCSISENAKVKSYENQSTSAEVQIKVTEPSFYGPQHRYETQTGAERESTNEKLAATFTG